MSEVRVASCRAGEIFDDPASAELFAEYAEECANPLLGPPAPDRARYEMLEELGVGLCFAAYNEERALCGFAFYVKGVPLHYADPCCATVESLFVKRAARASGLGVGLKRTVEAHAQEAGCEAIFYIAPVGSRLAKLLILEDECPNTNLVFTKRLA